MRRSALAGRGCDPAACLQGTQRAMGMGGGEESTRGQARADVRGRRNVARGRHAH